MRSGGMGCDDEMGWERVGLGLVWWRGRVGWGGVGWGADTMEDTAMTDTLSSRVSNRDNAAFRMRTLEIWRCLASRQPTKQRGARVSELRCKVDPSTTP